MARYLLSIAVLLMAVLVVLCQEEVEAPVVAAEGKDEPDLATAEHRWRGGWGGYGGWGRGGWGGYRGWGGYGGYGGGYGGWGGGRWGWGRGGYW